MTHDPMCPNVHLHYRGQGCQCDLIAKVRADERNKQEVTRVDV